MPFRIRNILVASDLSPSESAVLRSASALAALTEAELHVIHALEEGTLEGPAMEQRIRSAEDDLRANLRRALPATMDVSSSRVWPGSAHKAILERAREVDADLIVIGPHRRRDSRHEALGTTADRLVRTTSIPSMIVRRPISLPLRRVVIPTDFSPSAAGALDLALIWATALRLPRGSDGRTRLEVFHVDESAPGSPETQRDGTENRLEDLVAAACRRTGCGSGLELLQTVVAGDPPEEILSLVSEEQVDLLVMGTHGREERERALIGSVSSAVARQAPCPVLLCPPALARELSQRQEATSPGIRHRED